MTSHGLVRGRVHCKLAGLLYLATSAEQLICCFNHGCVLLYVLNVQWNGPGTGHFVAVPHSALSTKVHGPFKRCLWYVLFSYMLLIPMFLLIDVAASAAAPRGAHVALSG